MLTKLLAMTKAELKSKIQSIDASAVKGRALRRQLAGMKKKEGGFTLLELLVVVAILAAIAGTATIMLQDTDRKGAAAAHVAMMDELSKGIQTFRVLNAGKYPDNFDSLLKNGSATLAAATAVNGTDAADQFFNAALMNNLTLSTINAADLAALNSVGITKARVIDTTAVPNGGAAGDCATGTAIKALLASKVGNTTPQNIFRPVAANGCGAAADATLTAGDVIYTWASSGNLRVNAGASDKLVAFGVGPDSTLFNPSTIGALSNVPVYRHVGNTEYNRFIVLWNVSTTGGQATFQAIVDGAGDTKDEELGEVDNVRKT
jgi:prepilin-type N-terminal cleavage/methylation domain-containing protein